MMKVLLLAAPLAIVGFHQGGLPIPTTCGNTKNFFRESECCGSESDKEIPGTYTFTSVPVLESLPHPAYRDTQVTFNQAGWLGTAVNLALLANFSNFSFQVLVSENLPAVLAGAMLGHLVLAPPEKATSISFITLAQFFQSLLAAKNDEDSKICKLFDWMANTEMFLNNAFSDTPLTIEEAAEQLGVKDLANCTLTESPDQYLMKLATAINVTALEDTFSNLLDGLVPKLCPSTVLNRTDLFTSFENECFLPAVLKINPNILEIFDFNKNITDIIAFVQEILGANTTTVVVLGNSNFTYYEQAFHSFVVENFFGGDPNAPSPLWVVDFFKQSKIPEILYSVVYPVISELVNLTFSLEDAAASVLAIPILGSVRIGTHLLDLVWAVVDQGKRMIDIPKQVELFGNIDSLVKTVLPIIVGPFMTALASSFVPIVDSIAPNFEFDHEVGIRENGTIYHSNYTKSCNYQFEWREVVSSMITAFNFPGSDVVSTLASAWFTKMSFAKSTGCDTLKDAVVL